MRHLSNAIRGFAVTLLVLGASDGANGQTVPAGGATLASTTKLKVEGCPTRRGSGPTTYVLAADGSWSATVGSDTLPGTATSSSPNGRLWTIAYPPEALDEIASSLEESAGLACSSTFTISSRQASATLKLNKRQTRAKVTLQATFTGDAGGTPHNGTFKATGAGAWGTSAPGGGGGGGSCGPYDPAC